MRFSRITMVAALSTLLSSLALAGCSSEAKEEESADEGALSEQRCDWNFDCPTGQYCKRAAVDGYIDVCRPVDNTDYGAMDINCTSEAPPGRPQLYFTFAKTWHPDGNFSLYIYRGAGEDDKISGPVGASLDYTQTFRVAYPTWQDDGPWFSIAVKLPTDRSEEFPGELKVLRNDPDLYDAKVTCTYERRH